MAVRWTSNPEGSRVSPVNAGVVRPDGTAPSTATVLVTVPFAPDLLDRVATRAAPWSVAIWDPHHQGEVPDELWHAIRVAYTHDALPPEGAAPSLELVQLDTAGSDHLRDTWLWASQVAVTTLAGIAPPATAGYAFAMMLAHAHHLPEMLADQRAHRWPDLAERRERLTPRLLAGAHIGILGYGRIGREIGRTAKTFGMTVHGLRRTEEVAATVGSDSDPDHWWPASRVTDLVATCDYLVIALPHTVETRGYVGPDVVAAIKPDAFVVNVARGGIVDEAALLRRLEAGELAGAAFDVFDAEPLLPDSPWWDAPGALVSPHVAGLNPRYAELAVDLLCDNIERLRDGRPLRNLLDRQRGY